MLAASIASRGDADALAASLSARLEAVNARPARTPVGQLNRRAAADRRPVGGAAFSTVRAPLTASGGRSLNTRDELTEQVGRAFERLGKGQSQVIAGATWKLPVERQLTEDATSHGAGEIVASQEALVASGGTCLPVNVDYSVDVLGSTARPVRDALPRFGADRGGLRFHCAANPRVSGRWCRGVDGGQRRIAVEPGDRADPDVCLRDRNTRLRRCDSRTNEARQLLSRYNPEQVAAVLAQLRLRKLGSLS